jgi:hypothetical protein
MQTHSGRRAEFDPSALIALRSLAMFRTHVHHHGRHHHRSANRRADLRV